MALSLQQLAALPVTVQAIPIDGLPEPVYVRVMGGRQHDDFERMVVFAREQPGQWIEHFRSRFLALCLCDAEGNLLCQSEADVEQLGNIEYRILDQIIPVARELNGVNPRGDDSALEEAKKNLSDVPNEPSGLS